MDAAWDAEDGLAAFIGASDVDDDLVEGTALDVDTAYDVRVAAVGVLGVGAWADDTATPITETRAPGTPRNVLVRPAPGGLVVTWDRPLDPGNPPFENYVVEVKPTDGWDCNNPATGQPWTGAEEDFPLWVAVHCVNHYERVVNGETLPAGYYPPESGWAQTHINLSGSQSIGPYDGPNTYSMRFLTDGVEYQVRMRAEGPNIEDPDNAGEYIRLASDWSPVMTGTPGPRPPGVPQNLSVTPGDQSMAAMWASPEDPGDPELEGYVFQWRQAGATPPAAWESAVTLTAAYDVAMLTNGTEYEARVAGFHHHATWTAPAGVTVTYVLAAPGTGTACPADTDETAPAADCYVVIASESIGDYTEAATATPGAERPPSVPRNLQLLPGDQSLVALWDAPQDTGNPALDGYVVQWRQVTDPASDWTSFVTLGADGNDYELNAEDGIANDVEYQVRVAAFHKLPVILAEGVDVLAVLAASDVPAPEAGEEPIPACPSDDQPTADCYVVVPPGDIGPYTAIETATPSPLPTILTVVAGDAPLNPGLTPGVGQITVTWDAPAEEDRDPAHSGYIVQYRSLGATEWTDGPRIIYTADDPEPEDTNTREAVITGLAEGTYEVRVGTLLHGGAVLGSFTPPRRATVRVPGSPRNVVLIPGPGQLTAQWDAPEDRAENHAGYVVQYRAVGTTQWIEGPRIVYGDTDNDPNTPDILETPESRSATISPLAEGAYEVRVGTLLTSATLDSQGRTIVGQVPGIFSGPVRAEAKALRVPGPPRSMSAVIEVSPNDGSRSIYVYWNAPADQGNPPLTGYSVQYRRAGDAEWTGWTRTPRETAGGFRVWITGIGSHTDWEVRVAAVGPVWETGEYATSGQALRSPGPVASLTLTPGDRQIKAEWEPPEDVGNPPFAAYHVSYRVDGSGTWQTVAQSVRSKFLTGLTNGQLHHVQVRASNGAGYGPPVTLSVTPSAQGGDPVSTEPDPNLPGAPRNLALTAGYKWIVVEWDAPEFVGDPALHGYRIRYREAWTESFTTLRHDDLSINAITIDSGLANGKYYDVWVEAVHTKDGKQRTGPAAGPVRALPDEHGRVGPPYPERQPSAPRNLTLTPGNGLIEVSWGAPSRLFKDNPGYLVEYRKAGGRWTEEGEFRGTGATIGHLENGTTYEVRVTVFDAHGQATAGPMSATPFRSGPPTAPLDLALNPGDQQIEVSWDEPAYLGDPPIDGYAVEHRAAGEESWNAKQVAATSITFTITELENGTVYQVRVVAGNKHGKAIAGPKAATPYGKDDPKRPPTAPRNLTLTPGDERIDVSWEPPMDIGEEDDWLGYIVEIREVGEDGWFEDGFYQEPGTTIDYHVENGKTYELRVIAFNLHGRAVAGPMSVTLGGEQAGGGDGGGDAPTADAGLDQSVTEGARVTLAGKGSDPEGRTLTYAWTAPNGITLSDATAARPSFTAPDRTGDYTLTFTLVVNDGASDSVSDTVDISVSADNDAPTANAGPEKSVAEGEMVTLAGSGTDPEGQALTYAWTAPSGITLSSTTVANPTFTAPDRTADYTLTFSLKVNDGANDSAADTVAISVTEKEEPKRVPGAPAGIGTGGREGGFVVSWAAPSDQGNPPLTGYLVKYREGTSGSWLDAGHSGTGTSIEITGLKKGTEYQVQVAAVNDVGPGPYKGPVSVRTTGSEGDGGAGGQGKSDNQPPKANAGPDQSVNEGDTVTLAGKGSDPEGQTLTYAWTAPSGITLSSTTVAGPTFTAPDRDEDYTLTFSLVVNDGNSDSAADTVDINVSVEDEDAGGEGKADNQPPTANAGPDQSVTEGATVTLAGKGSDPEGQALTYAWTAPSGISLSSSAASPTFTAPDRTGDYTLTFSLVVNDGNSDSAADTVAIKVKADDDPPTANAGPDQSVDEGDTVTLAGKGSDPEGQSLTYAWTAPSGITLSSSTSASPTFTAPDRDEDYTLTFSLVVNDGNSKSAADTVVISVTVEDDGGAGGQGGEQDPERPPTAPGSLTLTPGDGIINVSWSASQDLGEPDDWIGYSVESRRVGDESWFEEGLYEGTSATVQDLENGVEYEVRVLAVNLYGQAVAGPKRATPTAG